MTKSSVKTLVTTYEKPTCSTCRVALGLLAGEGIEVREVNYYETPFTAAKLKSLIAKMGIAPRDLLRRNEPIFRELDLARRAALGGDLSDDEIVALMVKHPDLIQRPIVERGDRAILGRPPEKILEFLR